MLHVSTAVSESDPAQFFPPYFGLGLVQFLFRVLRRDPPSHDLLQSLQFDQSPKGFHPPSTGQCWVLQVCLLDCKLDPEHDFPLHLGDGLLHILDRDLVSVGARDPSVRQSAEQRFPVPHDVQDPQPPSILQ